MTAPQTHARHATMDSLIQILRTNHARKLDIVARPSAIYAQDGLIVVRGADGEITDSGVTPVDVRLLPTLVADDGLSTRLDIPKGYLARCRARNTELYDQNVNGWLAHPDFASKKYLVRAFRPGDDGVGVARAFLSDSYKPIDDLDVLMTVLEGVAEAGVKIDIAGCDLTDRNMYVRIVCEQVAINAFDLVKNYRSPFSGQTGADLPMAFAGFEIRNSEVGHGKFSIAPRIVLQVCSNGMTRRVDAFEAQHLGQKLDEGVIRWSDETQAANLNLITKKTADAVRTFLSPEYVQQFVDSMLEDAKVQVDKPEEVVRTVTTALRFDEARQDAILRMFIKGGDLTSGGVGHAVTAAAQEEKDGDLASDMEAVGLRAMALAARAAQGLSVR